MKPKMDCGENPFLNSTNLNVNRLHILSDLLNPFNFHLNKLDGEVYHLLSVSCIHATNPIGDLPDVIKREAGLWGIRFV